MYLTAREGSMVTAEGLEPCFLPEVAVWHILPDLHCTVNQPRLVVQHFISWPLQLLGPPAVPYKRRNSVHAQGQQLWPS